MSFNEFEPGTIVTIDGADYLPRGHAHGRMHLFHAITGAPFICADSNGAVSIPTEHQFGQLLLEGRAKVSPMPAKGCNGRLGVPRPFVRAITGASGIDRSVERPGANLFIH